MEELEWNPPGATRLISSGPAAPEPARGGTSEWAFWQCSVQTGWRAEWGRPEVLEERERFGHTGEKEKEVLGFEALKPGKVETGLREPGGNRLGTVGTVGGGAQGLGSRSRAT